MAFETEALDSTINWENVAANVATMVTGWGQMVYWKGCNVTVYEKDSKGKEQTRKLVGMPDGQGRLSSGNASSKLPTLVCCTFRRVMPLADLAEVLLDICTAYSKNEVILSCRRSISPSCCWYPRCHHD